MISYKDAGVDIDAGNSFVEGIKPFVKSTLTPNVIGGIGSFSGAFRLPTGYNKPTLLAATDGVGTKLRLAIDSGKLDSVGIDLVAMCVNDLICNFATPMFFLDYYATGKLDINSAKEVVSGIAKGCVIAKCALIGGETAEMPSMYSSGDFDLAGFAVGVAEEDEIDRSKFVNEGDILIALPSSGLHSNGFSLARAVIKKEKLNLGSEFEGKTLLETLLEPTRIYVDEFLRLKDSINAMAHITGGGIVENLPRVLPNGLGAKIQRSAIKTPKIFELIAKSVEQSEMDRTFNCGVGMVLVVPKQNVDLVLSTSDGYVIGEVVKQSGVQLC
ncbi:phosphoribosylformylglycinamidine cyclo-ligase [Campylobacter hyointestinalis]|uniref:Phosphoribosylformylglycinamidine cyclo-ligase n=1 Tax=Campylobacter hyointestinalis TaxID=198 RepID=A0A562XEJ4_CAMHY|nr:phosphoribosylformylglycinamidine cyclo-ligase [Campylobacter hyointestinalis]RAZ51283.1 phosphoribosylformylglycinamidine cyclo-ligase [Campylobacter hyointestinalis subsp. lawsonii]RAZ56605.1 phosphoribosylformylglycinamidine cyclo-ligase [Campylobacter hyointestinalis subsp. lawsonii]RAZ64678.1 phosphoribosylformylglycinamidine cyclo-ligase [Campylobacter hyointestinalis subsp. lawsonii]TWO20520.1 phosphoribosylformylglycinamidine cyclo-ligase [Campylobacter hyointestinalis]